MSQRAAWRSGIRASNAVFRTSIVRPSLPATARAASTSKPTDAFASVMSVDGKYSIGGYSMSTQSSSLPAAIRLVGGAIGVAVGAALTGGVVAPAWVGPVVAAPLLAHPARSAATAAVAAIR